MERENTLQWFAFWFLRYFQKHYIKSVLQPSSGLVSFLNIGDSLQFKSRVEKLLGVIWCLWHSCHFYSRSHYKSKWSSYLNCFHVLWNVSFSLSASRRPSFSSILSHFTKSTKKTRAGRIWTPFSVMVLALWNGELIVVFSAHKNRSLSFVCSHARLVFAGWLTSQSPGFKFWNTRSPKGSRLVSVCSQITRQSASFTFMV